MEFEPQPRLFRHTDLWEIGSPGLVGWSWVGAELVCSLQPCPFLTTAESLSSLFPH